MRINGCAGRSRDTDPWVGRSQPPDRQSVGGLTAGVICSFRTPSQEVRATSAGQLLRPSSVDAEGHLSGLDEHGDGLPRGQPEIVSGIGGDG